MIKKILVMLLLPTLALAMNFGKAGVTYPVIEKDLLTAVEEKASGGHQMR